MNNKRIILLIVVILVVIGVYGIINYYNSNYNVSNETNNISNNVGNETNNISNNVGNETNNISNVNESLLLNNTTNSSINRNGDVVYQYGSNDNIKKEPKIKKPTNKNNIDKPADKPRMTEKEAIEAAEKAAEYVHPPIIVGNKAKYKSGYWYVQTYYENSGKSAGPMAIDDKTGKPPSPN